MNLFARAVLLSLLPLATLPELSAETSVYTDPVGVCNVTLKAGTQAIGVPMLKPAVAGSLKILENTGGTVSPILTGVDFTKLLKTTSSYYLELTGATGTPSYVGDRFDVNVALTLASTTGKIILNAASPNNTLKTIPNLAGYSFVVRPHHTLASLFGTSTTGALKLTAAKTAAKADSVSVGSSTSSTPTTYYAFLKAGTTVEWRKVGDKTNKNYNDTPIPPGAGLTATRLSKTAGLLSMAGDVRTTSFSSLPLKAGSNLVSLPYPVAGTPATLKLNTRLTGNANPLKADQIRVWNGKAYVAYFLNGTKLQKVVKAKGDLPDYSTKLTLAPEQSFLIVKAKADPSFDIAKQF